MALAQEGLNAHHLALSATACGRTRAALEGATATYLGQNACILPQGYAELTLANADNEIRRRALAQLVQTIGGGDYQANAVSFDEILQNPDRRITLGNCLIELFNNRLQIMRENRNIGSTRIIVPHQVIQWDRFQVWANDAYEVSALDNNLPQNIPITLPKAAVITQPGFYHNGLLLAAPSIGYYNNPDLVDRCKAWFSPQKATGNVEFAIV